MSRFEWSMARREIRGSIRHFVFFLICIALGVGGLVGVGGFSAGFDSAVSREARNLMAADLQIRSNRPLSPDARAYVRSLERRGVSGTAAIEMIAMASEPESGASQLVELKAVGAGYPFYGELVTDPPGMLKSLPTGATALAEESLLIRLDVEIGQEIRLGDAAVRIVGVIEKEPDRVAGAFSLGPRMMISEETLAATRLIQAGSRVRYRTLLRIAATSDLEALRREMAAALAAEGVRVSTYREAQPRLRRFLENLATYLGLVGLTALLVGGIGVANSVIVFIRGRLDTLAILKCLGADSRQVLRVYLIQTVLLGAVGCLAGILIGGAVQWILPLVLSDLISVSLEWKPPFLPAFRGLVMGMLTVLLFSTVPLLAIRDVKPARVLRRDLAAGGGMDGAPDLRGRLASGRESAWVGAGIAAGLAALTLWQAGSLDVGLLFIGILCGSMILLALAAYLLIRTLKGLGGFGGLVWRHGLGNIHRPGNQSVLAVLSIGVGVTIILGLLLIEKSLMRQVGEHMPKDAPTFFFIDIQQDQKESFRTLLARRNQTVELTPIVRSRLYAIDGERVSEMDLGDRRDAWYFQREYVLTSSSALPKDNRILEGRWWPSDPGPAVSRVSVEEEAARHLGVTLGSTLSFDVQGVLLQGVVSSIREVDWGNMSTNFYMILSPGMLSGAPTTYVGTSRSEPEQDEAVQRLVASNFPNVTSINIRHVIDTIRNVLERIALVLRFMAALTIGAGIVVLAGAIAATRHWRTRESVVFKTLGATRGILARTFAVEYGVLGLIA